MDHPNSMISCKSTNLPSQSVIKYRKQVIWMLGTVVLAFFICLLPFRALTMWIIIAPASTNFEIGFENYYNILYFSRIMFHINSAVNPILYNIMSSKFRGGFLKVCGIVTLRKRLRRKREITRRNTTSSTTHTSSQQTSESFLNSKKNHSKYSNKSLRDSSSGESSKNNNRLNSSTRCVYVRAPMEIVSSISGQKLPNGEIYV
ncbi:unnamed protein product [Brassicogethes aeneus]|uniref:G-protein coupled receptors family 1 profile domain-containing protein n=1 Tax=Brassicogethes aeneus TaxID=1431903 RepID=A0A9P0FHN4_BRAAE|nr:unnamed protein product [Brassicogethes aeneus]